MNNLESNERILIKTYLHESGLWYLGLSLYKELVAAGHEVLFIPKSRFVKTKRGFARTYTPGIPKYSHLTIPFSQTSSVSSQIISAVYEHKASTIISLETFMRTSSWIQSVKSRTGAKVIDVPMLEWASPSKLSDGSYGVFEEVWATTDITMSTFKRDNSNIRRVSWNFADDELFYKTNNNHRGFKFYHQGSLNPNHSSKNTDLVLKAFKRLNYEFNDVYLEITGVIQDDSLLEIVKKHTNITAYRETLSRQEIAELYRNTDCVIVPSSKEGLGLSLFEAEACGSKIITTDAQPMNSHNTKYLCEISGFEHDGSLVPFAKLTEESIYKQMKRVYEEEYDRQDYS